MNTPKQAVEVLAEAETKLRKLVAEAATAGAYDAIPMVAEWARIIGAMARESLGAEGVKEQAVQVNADESPRGEGSRSGAPIAKGAYPRFFRRADSLVKIGWSRNEKKEYEHGAPRYAVDLLAIAIARKSRNGNVFTAKDIFPLRVKDGGHTSEVPTYQAYVALAWLRQAGLVKQLGRRGYSVRKSLSMRLPDAVAAEWQKLPEASA